MGREYYSRRKKLAPKTTYTQLTDLISSYFKSLLENGYYVEHFGYHCVDGFYPGLCGYDVVGYIFRKTRIKINWPIADHLIELDEAQLFDIIEFMHDHVSYPLEGEYHSYNNCGMHYTSFDKEKGKVEFVEQINELLADYKDGYHMSPDGEIEMLLPSELNRLINTKFPSNPDDEFHVTQKVALATKQFRIRNASLLERMNAVRVLAEVLEYLLPKIKQSEITKKDERDLFNIANNFCIRHNDINQKKDYSIEWLCWIFHVYLATIHMCMWYYDRQANE